MEYDKMNTQQKKELLTDINNYIKLDTTMADGPSPGLLALKTQIEAELEQEQETEDKIDITCDDINTIYQNNTTADITIIKTIEKFFEIVNPHMQDFEEFMDELQTAMNEYQGYTDEN